jgi:hypothetical protein
MWPQRGILEKYGFPLYGMAKEGCTFVLGCCMAMKVSDIPDSYEFKKLYKSDKEWVNVGNSAIVSPSGECIAGPSKMEEEILYAEIDLKQIRASKWILDVAGNYARSDIFRFTINHKPNVIMQTENLDTESSPIDENCAEQKNGKTRMATDEN